MPSVSCSALREPFESPAIEFSLVSSIPATSGELWSAPQLLGTQFADARQVAEYARLKVIGLFLAWASHYEPHQHQVFGLWMDIAQEMKLPYVVLFPTLGYEAHWGSDCYFAGRFPHNALGTRTTRGKLSSEPRHNPRRVRALWNELIRSTSGV